jgi:hypothetical protein
VSHGNRKYRLNVTTTEAAAPDIEA